MKSRFHFAPINTGFTDYTGVPDDDFVRFHTNRSGNGVGICYVGNVSIDSDYRSNSSTPILNLYHEQKWKELSSGIAQNGSIPAIQIACRFSQAPAIRKWADKNRKQSLNEYSEFLSSFNESELDIIFEKFVDAAAVGVRVGFEIIQLHAAHGYFLSSLLNPVINKRVDKYCCANLGNIKSLIKNVKSRTGALLDVRFSVFDGLEIDFNSEWNFRKRQIIELESAGVDIISLSGGLYDYSKHLIYPGRKEPNIYLSNALDLLQHTKAIVNVAGNIRKLIDVIKFDDRLHFSIGRPLIADPLFIEKSLSFRAIEINECNYCGQCHYYTRGKEYITCGVTVLP